MIETIEQMSNNFCFLTLGDITSKEITVVETILSSFDIDYVSINKISNNKDYLDIVKDIIDYGIKNIIIDIKVGYKINEAEAHQLSQLILNLTKNSHTKITCFITSLELSLGTSFGYLLEKDEINDILCGKNITMSSKLFIKIASYILSINNNLSLEESQKLIINNINNGIYKIEGNDNLLLSSKIFSIKSSKSGFIRKINILEIEDLLNKLGYDDKTVGLLISNQIGDYVLENEELAKVYLSDKDIQATEVLDCFLIKEEIDKQEELVMEIVG